MDSQTPESERPKVVTVSAVETPNTVPFAKAARAAGFYILPEENDVTETQEPFAVRTQEERRGATPSAAVAGVTVDALIEKHLADAAWRLSGVVDLNPGRSTTLRLSYQLGTCHLLHVQIEGNVPALPPQPAAQRQPGAS